MAFSDRALSKAHGPAARRKAARTRRRNLAAKAKANGKTTIFNVADLPLAARKGKTANGTKRRAAPITLTEAQVRRRLRVAIAEAGGPEPLGRAWGMPSGSIINYLKRGAFSELMLERLHVRRRVVTVYATD